MSVAELIPAETGELALFTPQTAVAVLTSPERFSEFYARVKAETDKLVPDVSCKRGRDAIRSMARKVVTTKTAIDAEGKRLNEDARAKINVVDAARRRIRDELDGLAEEVRAPLTKWEEAEEARQTRCGAVLDTLNRAATILATETSADLSTRLAAIQAIGILDDEFQEIAEGARFAQTQAVEALTAGIERARAAEEERAELERLRAEAVERERQRVEAEAVEAARQLNARREAEEAERQRIIAERAAQAERDRLQAIEDAKEAARQEAIQAAERERERVAEEARQQTLRAARQVEQERRRLEQEAEAERARIQATHDAEVAELRRQAEVREAEAARAEAARQAEARRIAAEQAAAAEAQRRREADMAHKGRILGEAKAAIMEHLEIDEVAAKSIVRAIAARLIPHIAIQF